MGGQSLRWGALALLACTVAACGSSGDGSTPTAGGGGKGGQANAQGGSATAGASAVSGDSGSAGSANGGGGASSGASGVGGGSAGASGSAGVSGGAGVSGNAGAGGVASGPPDQVDQSGPSVNGSITVNRATTIGKIGPGFAGLSYEKIHLEDGFFRASNAPLIALFKLLGPSVLRLGGNSVDRTNTDWTPAGAGKTSGQIAKADVDGLAAFAKASGWTVIYGVNLKTSTAAVAADEATYAANALGTQLYGFEIGNEVGGYLSYSDFKTKWEAFAAAIRARVPKAPMTGPATEGGALKGYTVPFAKDEAAQINLLTHHYYRGNGLAAGSTIDYLLNTPDPVLTSTLSTLQTAASTNQIANAYRMGETNSYYNGGSANVSNAYGTALWAIDYLFTVAQYGSSGVNFHVGGITAPYNPIQDDGAGTVTEARPDYYGILLFSRVGSGTMYQTKVNVSGVSFSAYAVGAPDGSTSLVLVNKDRTKRVHATVDLGKAATSASVARLAGPSLDATSGVTLAGAGVKPTGEWAPAPLPYLVPSGSSLVIDVPPASAALVHLP